LSDPRFQTGLDMKFRSLVFAVIARCWPNDN
jgi:hypothetical protein